MEHEAAEEAIRESREGGSCEIAGETKNRKEKACVGTGANIKVILKAINNYIPSETIRGCRSE